MGWCSSVGRGPELNLEEEVSRSIMLLPDWMQRDVLLHALPPSSLCITSSFRNREPRWTYSPLHSPLHQGIYHSTRKSNLFEAELLHTQIGFISPLCLPHAGIVSKHNCPLLFLKVFWKLTAFKAFSVLYESNVYPCLIYPKIKIRDNVLRGSGRKVTLAGARQR